MGQEIDTQKEEEWDEETLVERRREPRFATGQSVRLIVLDKNGTGPDRPMSAELTDVSGKGMRFRTPQRVSVGEAVRVDIEDNAILGEVCHSSESAGGYVCGVEIDQVLSRVSDLARLMQALVGSNVGAGAVPQSRAGDRATSRSPAAT